MTGHGIAILTLILTNAGSVALAIIQVFRARTQRNLDTAQLEEIEAKLHKDVGNRRIALENYADSVARYHRDLRRYLMDLGDQGIIDRSQVDMSTFPRPPELPQINGS